MPSRILGLIPARGGSKGVPHKNLRALGGRPLIAHTIQAARQSRELTRIVVSTDSEELAAVARQCGADVPFLRPKELARDETPMIDVVRHTVGELQRMEWGPEIVALLQPTVPFRHAADLDEGIRRLCASSADALVSVSAVPPKYHPAWQFVLSDGFLVPAGGGSCKDLPARRQDLETTYARNGAFYVFKVESLSRSGSIYGEHALAHVMTGEPPVNIDTLTDWDQAEQYFQRSEAAR